MPSHFGQLDRPRGLARFHAVGLSGDGRREDGSPRATPLTWEVCRQMLDRRHIASDS